MRKWISWVASTTLVVLGVTAAGQSPSLTNDDVLAMVKAGLSSDTIELAISRSTPLFDTSAGALIRLKTAGVAEPVIRAMINATGRPAPIGVPPTSRGNQIDSQTAQSIGSAAVPPTSGLYGVIVTQRAEHVVTISALPDGSEAANAGLRVGDRPIGVNPGGPDGPGRGGGRLVWTTDQFYRLASKCIPDCLVSVIVSGRGGNTTDTKQVGSPRNFSAIVRPGNYHGYVDNVTKSYYPTHPGPGNYSDLTEVQDPAAWAARRRLAEDVGNNPAAPQNATPISPISSRTAPSSALSTILTSAQDEATQARIRDAEQRLQGLQNRYNKESRELQDAQGLAQLARLGCNMSTGTMKTSNCFQADLQDIGVSSRQRSLKQLEVEIQDAQRQLNALRAAR